MGCSSTGWLMFREDGGASSSAVGSDSMIFEVGACFSDAGPVMIDGGVWSEFELGAGAGAE